MYSLLTNNVKKKFILLVDIASIRKYLDTLYIYIYNVIKMAMVFCIYIV